MSFAMITATITPKKEEDFWDVLSYNVNHNHGKIHGVLFHQPVVMQGDLFVSKWYFDTGGPIDDEVPLAIVLDEVTRISPGHKVELNKHADQLVRLVIEMKRLFGTEELQDYTMTDGNFLIIFRKCQMDPFIQQMCYPPNEVTDND
jgi:hypothetical protein